jgi:AraC-like DNA-binding protein
MCSSLEATAKREHASPCSPGSRGVALGQYANSEVHRDERPEHWRHRLADVFDIPQPDDPDDYLIETRRWLIPGMALVSGSYPAMKMVRTHNHIRRDQLDHYMVNVRRSGLMKVDANGAYGVAHPLQPMLTDLSQPSIFDGTAGENFNFYVRRDELDALLPRALDLHGVTPRGIASALLASHLVMLERHLPEVSAEEAEGLKACTLHLLAASLAPSINSLGLARPSIEVGVMRLIRQYIEQHLQDEQLSADSLCRQFHVSRSTLYRLFEPLSGVTRYIRERRLARCHSILSTPGPRMYIERLANDYGFSTASQFSRAFHNQFGYSPREAFLHHTSDRPYHAVAQTGAADFRATLEALSR